MKKLLVIVAVVLLSIGLVFAQDNPFKEVKEWAMKATPNEDGNYFLQKTVKEEGKVFELTVGYVPKRGQIGVVIKSGEQAMITLYSEESGRYEQALVDGLTILGQGEITQEEAWGIANLVLGYFKKGSTI